MKKIFIRSLSLVLCITVMCVSLPMIYKPMKASAAQYTFLDYTRIYGSKTGKSYDVDLTFGTMNLKGKLRYTGSYTEEEIDAAVDRIFYLNGINEKDIKYAQDMIKKWEKEKEFTVDDAANIATNIAAMFGVDPPLKLAREIYDFVRGEKTGWQSVLNITGQVTEMVTSQMQEKVHTWFYREVVTTLLVDGGKAAKDAGTMLVSFRDEFRDGKIKVGKFSIGQKAMVDFIINVAKVSVEQWKADKERWKTRVDAVNATAFMDSFYNALNEYLQSTNPSAQNWVLTVAGEQKRYFNFFGSKNNVQVTTLALSAAKDKVPSLVYVFRGDRTNLPFGTYTGSSVITINNDLSNFDADFWNLPIGILKRNWLDDLIDASTYAGGLILDIENDTHISRKLTAKKLTFTIPGGYSEQYSANIPATVGNRDVVTTIPLSAFKDDVKVEATHLLDYEWGLATEDGGALDYVSLRAHAEMTNGNLSLIFDKTKALVWILGVTFADVDQNYVSAGNSWDDNIWANMDKGIKLTVKFR